MIDCETSYTKEGAMVLYGKPLPETNKDVFHPSSVRWIGCPVGEKYIYKSIEVPEHTKQASAMRWGTSVHLHRKLDLLLPCIAEITGDLNWVSCWGDADKKNSAWEMAHAPATQSLSEGRMAAGIYIEWPFEAGRWTTLDHPTLLHAASFDERWEEPPFYFVNDVRGTPDIFVIPPFESHLSPLVIELKSGSQRVSDIKQLRIYQWLLDQTLEDHRKARGMLIHNFKGWSKIQHNAINSNVTLIPWAPLNPIKYWADVIEAKTPPDPVELERCGMCGSIANCDPFWKKYRKLSAGLSQKTTANDASQFYKMTEILRQRVKDWLSDPAVNLKKDSTGWYERKTFYIRKLSFKEWVKGATARGVDLQEALSFGSLTSVTLRDIIKKYPALKEWLNEYLVESSSWAVTTASPDFDAAIANLESCEDTGSCDLP